MIPECTPSRIKTARCLSSLLCLLGIYSRTFRSRMSLQEVALSTLAVRTSWGVLCGCSRTEAVNRQLLETCQLQPQGLHVSQATPREAVGLPLLASRWND